MKQMDGHKVDIHITPTGSGSTISIDGVPFGHQIRSFSVHVESGKPSLVVLEFVAHDVTITGAADEVLRRSRLAGGIDAGQTCSSSTRRTKAGRDGWQWYPRKAAGPYVPEIAKSFRS